MIRAVEKFDPNVGFRFQRTLHGGYDNTIEVAKSMNQTSNHSFLPIHVSKSLNVYLRSARELTQNWILRTSSEENCRNLIALLKMLQKDAWPQRKGKFLLMRPLVEK